MGWSTAWSPDGSMIAAVTLHRGGRVHHQRHRCHLAPHQVSFAEVNATPVDGRRAAKAPRDSAVAWTQNSREVVLLAGGIRGHHAWQRAVIIRQDVQTGVVLDQHWAPERAAVLDAAGNERVGVRHVGSPRGQPDGDLGRERAPHRRPDGESRQTERTVSPCTQFGDRTGFASNRTGTVDYGWCPPTKERRQGSPRLRRPSGPAFLLRYQDALQLRRIGTISEIWVAKGDGSGRVPGDDRRCGKRREPDGRPDGQWIAVRVWASSQRACGRFEADGTQARAVAGDVQIPSVSPDGSTCSTGSPVQEARAPPGCGLADGAPRLSHRCPD